MTTAEKSLFPENLLKTNCVNLVYEFTDGRTALYFGRCLLLVSMLVWTFMF